MKARYLILFFFLFAFLGYYREMFFVQLNIIMYEKYYHSVSPVQVTTVLDFFKNFSYDTLYYSKYIYTVIWTTAFFATSYFTVKKLTDRPFLPKVLIYTYCLMFALAAISMAYGFFINQRLQDDEYTLSRWLLGIAQSPIICLILVASEKLYTKSFQS